MKELIKKELNKLVESQTYGQDGIAKKVVELGLQKEKLIAQRNQLNKKINKINKEIKKWEKEISPNQISMF